MVQPQLGGRPSLVGAGLVGEARTQPAFQLHDLGPYPGLVAGGEHTIVGELYAVDEATLTALDRLAMTDLVHRQAEFLLYQSEDGQTRVEVRFDGETAWLSLGQMAALFQRDKSVISRHIKNVFDEGALSPASTVAQSATVQQEGSREVTREVEYFNLDVIISVGYRVKSHRGTQFRIWATQRLREYIIKGFTLDDERLKRAGGGNYFDELLARIRDIRSSEKVFWRKVRVLRTNSPCPCLYPNRHRPSRRS